MALLTTNVLQRFAEFWKTRGRALSNFVIVGSLHGQRIILQFREAGALSPSTALPFRAQSRIEELEFKRLLRAHVIREPSPGRYFLDMRSLDRTKLWFDA